MHFTKSFLNSKLNWVGAALAIAPHLKPLLEAIPEEYRPLAVSIGGVAVVVLRTFFTSQPVHIRK